MALISGVVTLNVLLKRNIFNCVQRNICSAVGFETKVVLVQIKVHKASEINTVVRKYYLYYEWESSDKEGALPP